MATSSLRFIETPAAERLLVRMLRDASREVRLQAIEAFNHRRISQALLPELAQYLREESQKTCVAPSSMRYGFTAAV